MREGARHGTHRALELVGRSVGGLPEAYETTHGQPFSILRRVSGGLRGTAPVSRALRSRPQPHCPLCGERGAPLYDGLRDRLLGRPEAWSLVRCRETTCGLLWLDPQPIEEEIALAYAGAYPTHLVHDPPQGLVRRLYLAVERGYFAHAFGYDSPTVRAWQRLTGRALAWLPLRRAGCDFRVMHLTARPGGRLLDVGCGSGAHLMLLRQLGWRVEGVDFDPSAVAAARARGLEVRCGTIDDQGYAAGVFDAVVASHVLEHLFDPVRFIRECSRILAPGGRLVLVTPNTASASHKRFGSSWFPLEPPRHIMMFHSGLLRRLVEQTELTVERLTTSVRGAGPNWMLSRRIQTDGVADLYRPPSRPERVGVYLSALAAWAFCLVSRESGEELVLVARRGSPPQRDG
ncbi:MAG: methyltransferase domain-containing protein [Luteitalea sp.]|nr:methyltransferase domain-containing protein [Luteitalea sp.]